MASKYDLIHYFLTILTEMLMKKRKMAFDEALSTVLSSKTYSSLFNDGALLNEGDLFVFEQLEKELA